MMKVYMWIIYKCYEDHEYNGNNGNYHEYYTKLEYKNLKENINDEYFLIEMNKLKNTIDILKNNNIIKQINSFDSNKRISYKDYTGGAYHCNEAPYYMCIHAICILVSLMHHKYH